MKNYFVSLYQVLKALEVSSCNNTFDYDKTLDLAKLKISQQELDIIIKNIVDDGLVKGITIPQGCTGFKASNPHLTTLGYDFLKNNTEMKKAYKIIKEIKDWLPGY